MEQCILPSATALTCGYVGLRAQGRPSLGRAVPCPARAMLGSLNLCTLNAASVLDRELEQGDTVQQRALPRRSNHAALPDRRALPPVPVAAAALGRAHLATRRGTISEPWL